MQQSVWQLAEGELIPAPDVVQVVGINLQQGGWVHSAYVGQWVLSDM